MTTLGRTPRWLSWLERRIGWLEIPNIAILLVTLQGLGFLMVASNPAWAPMLALYPDAVLREGEFWRLVTFLSLPISMSPLWVIFVLWFLYFVVSTIENEWGAFKTTFYTLISVVLTITYSLVFGYPVTSIAHFESSLFLAAAALYPEFEVRLFLIFPVKMKYLAWFTAAFAIWQFATGTWLDRGHLLAIYSNFVVFFGPSVLERVKQWNRRRTYRRRSRLE